MSKDNAFMLLLAGLQQFNTNPANYPLPADLRYSLNILAFYMGTNFPHTMNGLFTKFREPLKNWWPAELKLPPDFDNEVNLVTYDKELSEDAQDFLYDWAEETGVTLWANTATKSSAGDNLVMSQLIKKLHEKDLQANEAEHPQIQTEYVELRQFIIRTPYVTSADLRPFSHLRYISKDFADDFYTFVADPAKTYWQCEKCGPLVEKSDGNLAGRKPGMCNDHDDKAAKHIKKIAGSPNLRVLKSGLHMRVLIPGIPELRLFDWLEEIRAKHPDHLQMVYLWPGLDRYDLQLCFSDEIWAVDVKDYKNPHSLATKLIPIPGEGTLAYQKSFYVFPAYRLSDTPNYREIALEQAIDKPTSTELLSDEQFKSQVEAKIRQMSKKKKGAK